MMTMGGRGRGQQVTPAIPKTHIKRNSLMTLRMTQSNQEQKWAFEMWQESKFKSRLRKTKFSIEHIHNEDESLKFSFCHLVRKTKPSAEE